MCVCVCVWYKKQWNRFLTSRLRLTIGKRKKRNASLWTPYMRVVVICIWGEEAIKRPNWRGSHVILKAESRHWVKKSWRELRSRVTLKVGASSIVGVKEFRPLFSLQYKFLLCPILISFNIYIHTWSNPRYKQRECLLGLNIISILSPMQYFFSL